MLYLDRASKVALVIKNLPASAGDTRDTGSIPGLGRSPGEGNGNSLQYSCLENSMDRGSSLVGYSPWGCKESDTTEKLNIITASIIIYYLVLLYLVIHNVLIMF